MIELLFEGAHQNHQHEGHYYSIDPLASSVILIQTEGVNVLFDTSSMIYTDKLLAALKERGLTPKDIHHVINSHNHLDHTFNDYLFAKTAIIHTAHATLDKEGVAHIFPTDEARDLPKTIELLDTPGHTTTDMSLVYEWEDQTWVCAGDAVREDIICGDAHFSTTRPKQLIESMKLIFDRADVIIPGHGPIIQGARKQELHELLNNLTLPVDDN